MSDDSFKSVQEHNLIDGEPAKEHAHQNSNSDYPMGAWRSVLLSLFIYLFVSSFIFILVAQLLGRSEVFDNPDVLSTQDSFIIQSTIYVVGATTVLVAVKGRAAEKLRRLRFTLPSAKTIGLTIVAFVPYAIATGLLLSAVDVIFPGFDLEQEQELGIPTEIAGADLGMTFLLLVVLTPLYEELLFRGLMFRSMLGRYSPIISALIVSVLFGIAHGQLNVALDTFVLSLVACYLIYKTDTIWSAILLHSIKNGIAFVFVFVLSNG